MSARKKKNEREKKRRERKGRRKIEEKNSIFRETFARHWDALRRTKLGYSRAWKFDWPAAALMISCARERESFASHQRTGFLAFDDGPVDVTVRMQATIETRFIPFNFVLYFFFSSTTRVDSFFFLASHFDSRFDFFFSYKNPSGLSLLIWHMLNGNEKQRDGWYNTRS